jgi:hypothetical protein
MTEINAMTVNDYLASNDHWRGRKIAEAIGYWVFDAFEHETDFTREDVLRHLESIDCAACHAPAGLIYNGDIWAKVPEWADEIDQALWEYQDATGEPWEAPGDGTLTVGLLVWFAVEWEAHEIASELRNEWGM